MKFRDLEKRMRAFETSHDRSVPPGVFMVARLDGRSFTRLTRERYSFKKLYDLRGQDKRRRKEQEKQHAVEDPLFHDGKPCCDKVLFAAIASTRHILLIALLDGKFNPAAGRILPG